jgi:hypothetical protein
LIYVTSFFLVGVPGSTATGGPIRGYVCAWAVFALPFTASWSKNAGPLLLPFILLAGLTNPIFIAAVVAYLIGSRFFQVLTISVLALFPFCWVVAVASPRRLLPVGAWNASDSVF